MFYDIKKYTKIWVSKVAREAAKGAPKSNIFNKNYEVGKLFRHNCVYYQERGSQVCVLRKYSAAQIKWDDFLHPITWLSLERFLIFLDESYRARRMQAIDTKHIKIGQFV